MRPGPQPQAGWGAAVPQGRPMLAGAPVVPPFPPVQVSLRWACMCSILSTCRVLFICGLMSSQLVSVSRPLPGPGTPTAYPGVGPWSDLVTQGWGPTSQTTPQLTRVLEFQFLVLSWSHLALCLLDRAQGRMLLGVPPQPSLLHWRLLPLFLWRSWPLPLSWEWGQATADLSPLRQVLPQT